RARPLGPSRGRGNGPDRALARAPAVPDLNCPKREWPPTTPAGQRAVACRGGNMALVQRIAEDVSYLRAAMRALRKTTHIARSPTRVFPHVIDDLAERFGDAPALLSDRERFTYRTLAERSNRYSRWALAHGVAKGDTVCLLMGNRPEYMAIWLG